MSEPVPLAEPCAGDSRIPWQGSVLLVHCAALFLGSFLLFAIQPMFTKMVLPLLGGTPAVWNTAVMFFQAMLLAGYLYAHLLSRVNSLRVQVLVHGAVLIAGLLFLPVRVVQPGAPSGAHPVLWLVAMLAISIGLPFFAVSATAPLLQRWFSRSGHPRAADPYFLYVSSNIGGLGALLAYPVVVEPLLGLMLQSRAWAGGYGLLAMTIGLCSIGLRRWNTSASAVPPGPAADADPVTGTRLADVISWETRAHWVALAFVPSALLLAVTSHISTDVASVPFLWVIPLSLYMLSFIIVFARRPVLKHNWMLNLQIVVYALLAMCFVEKAPSPLLVLHLLALFVTAMVCHGELVRRRLAARHLTEFYLWLSVGGLLGGVFCVMVAPMVFNSVLEYPLVLVLACMLRPGVILGSWRSRLLDVVLPASFAVAYFFLRAYLDFGNDKVLSIAGPLSLSVAVIIVFCMFRHRPLRLTLAFAPLIFSSVLLHDISHQLVRMRSFFGVYTVAADKSGDIHYLYHGNIVHGSQWTDPDFVAMPTGYYCREGPLGQVFEAMGSVRPIRHVGCIGLGTGTTACYQQPGRTMTFFEVDPVMERIARDPKLFRYLDLHGDGVEVVLGDGRQGLSRMPDGTFDLIALDAFSSDAIPIHMLTREALDICMRKLSPGGIAMFHTSNRYVNLEPVLANLVEDAGLAALIQEYYPTDDEKALGASISVWVAVARDDDDLRFLDGDDRWWSLEPDPAVGLWTDDYSNIFRTLIWDELLQWDALWPAD